MKSRLKNTIFILSAIALATCVVFVPIRGFTDSARVPVLLYHNLVDSLGDDDNAMVNITPATFRAHMRALKVAGFEAITFDDYYDYRTGDGTLPARPVVITFDDGYISNYKDAYPILKELGLKATIFIVTGTVGATDGVSYPHFTWEQAREMQKSGVIDIQSHSHTHSDMTTLDVGQIVRETRLSKYLIDKNLGKDCKYFAFPFGAYNDECAWAGAAAGYLLQCRLGVGGYNTKDTPPERLNRITVPGDLDAQSLLRVLEQNMNLSEAAVSADRPPDETAPDATEIPE
ncbi:hypothetical protein FACS189492_3010 [Clostridia bacterium]|nr:hypothetical protein FACS189492_3010 [Clostridia bacterium]